MCPSPLSWAGAIAFVILVNNVACAQVAATPATTPATPSAPAAQAAPFTLDLAAAASQDVTLTVQSPSQIPFKIIHAGGPLAAKAMLDVSPFVNDQGVVQLFTISVGNAAAAADGTNHVGNIAFENPVLTANLNVPQNLPLGSKYTGRLILTVPGQAQPIVWRFLLTPADELRPATLVLDRNAATATAIRPMFCLPWSDHTCFGGEPATVTVHVRDKTGNSPLNAVTARMESSPGAAGAAGSGFDPANIVAATFDGRDAGNIFTSPATGVVRDVAAHGQGTITLTFNKTLDAGEYIVPLRFTAANSGDDDLQRLSVTVRARDPIFWAGFVLVLAACLSFLATRVVSMLRQRANFLARVHAMRPAWLAQEPQIPPVIGLRATLRQSEDLSRRFWLTGQKEIDARLTAAGRMLAILDRLRRIRGRISAIPDEMVKQRANWKLDEVTDQLDETPLTDQDVTRLDAQLDTFDDWCAAGSDKQTLVYWEDVQARIHASLTQVKPFTDAATQALAATWTDMLRTAIASKPTDLGPMSDADLIHRRLTILWGARNHPDWVRRIVALHPAAQTDWAPIEELYRVIDEGWWAILNDKQEIQCTAEGPPDSTLDPPEAYESVRFGLNIEATNAANQDLQASFLMRKQLTYLWTFTITTKSWRPWRGTTTEAKTLKVKSIQPQVAQYSPTKGQIAATSVGITYRGRPGPSVQASAQVGIAASSDFRVWRITEHADACAFFVALLVSVVSGIKLYALGPTFGSLADYLALFTWGASVDQGKNFLQSLAAYSSDAPATPGAAAPAPDAHAK